MSEPTAEAEVQGLSYDEANWKLVAEQMDHIGNVLNRVSAGKSGFLFWETSGNIDKLIKQVAFMNKHGRWVEFPDEES